jgi:hypothetical protein
MSWLVPREAKWLCAHSWIVVISKAGSKLVFPVRVMIPASGNFAQSTSFYRKNT